MVAGQAVIVADAHLYHSPESPSDTLFHEFLLRVPEFGSHLIINGDLFDFWFEYKAVIPRQVFPTLATLAALRRKGVSLTITGGNHDRWGGRFWRDQLQADFWPDGCDVEIGGLSARVQHGDGLAEKHTGARALHWLTRRKLVRNVFHAIHPDIGFWGVRRMSRLLGESSRAPEVIQQAASNQRRLALDMLAARRNLQLVILGHTHVPALVEAEPGRWYLNPGAWMQEHRFAIVRPEGPELRVFER